MRAHLSCHTFSIVLSPLLIWWGGGPRRPSSNVAAAVHQVAAVLKKMVDLAVETVNQYVKFGCFTKNIDI